MSLKILNIGVKVKTLVNEYIEFAKLTWQKSIMNIHHRKPSIKLCDTGDIRIREQL
jgi:hypothetical protein